ARGLRREGHEIAGRAGKAPVIDVRGAPQVALAEGGAQAGRTLRQGQRRGRGRRVVVAVLKREAGQRRRREDPHERGSERVAGPVGQGGAHGESVAARLERAVRDAILHRRAGRVARGGEGVAHVVGGAEGVVGAGAAQVEIGHVVDRVRRHVFGEGQAEAVHHGRGRAALGRQAGARDGRRQRVGQVEGEHVLGQQAVAAGGRGDARVV